MKLVTTKTFYFILSMTFNFDSRRLYDEYILWKKIFLLWNSWTKEFMTVVCFILIYPLFLDCSLPLDPTTS